MSRANVVDNLLHRCAVLAPFLVHFSDAILFAVLPTAVVMKADAWPAGMADDLCQQLNMGRHDVRVGIDTVEVSGIAASLQAFGERFVTRLFTPQEIATCGRSAGQRLERLAARFAAKEAALKAFNLAEAGVNWRDIEVRGGVDSPPTLHLQGRAADDVRQLGCFHIALSLSHDGDRACAVVAALAAGRGGEMSAAVALPS